MLDRRQKRADQKRRLRLFGKAALLLLGCAFGLFLAGRTVTKIAAPVREENGDFISIQEAGNLIWLLADTAQEKKAAPGTPQEVLDALKRIEGDGDAPISYGQAMELIRLLTGSDNDWTGQAGRAYLDGESLEADDFYAWFDQARKVYDPEGKIRDATVTVLWADAEATGSDAAADADVAGGDAVADADTTGEGAKADAGNGASSGRVPAATLMDLTQAWNYHTSRLSDKTLLYRPLNVVTRDGGIYAVRGVEAASDFTLSNVWVVQMEKQAATVFVNGREIRLELPLLSEGEVVREQVADLVFRDGGLFRAVVKNDKVSGKLLRVTDKGAEVEGQGFLPFSDTMKIYRLSGETKSLTASDLPIGAAFTDFVLEKGKIAAALVLRWEKMENIRVLIRTSGYNSVYHDSVVLQADCACTIFYGGAGKEKQKALAAGEKLTLDGKSGYFKKGELVRVVPDIRTGHISLPSVERSQGTPSFRGSFEIRKEKEGLVAVNEVLLEEYLYAVVPGEMPAAYPMEALKSQAVCARTFAFLKMQHAGLPQYGAHVDDSVSFQVYQNIAEQENTTKAVKETAGQVLFYENEPAQTYYYSTSCGYTTDMAAWQGKEESAENNLPYLEAQPVMAAPAGTTGFFAETDGENGGDPFLQDGDSDFYEKDEPWYRWTYEVSALDTDTMSKRIRQRYQAAPDSVLTQTKDGAFSSVTPPDIGRLKAVSVSERGAGGIACGLLLKGEGGTVLVKKEYNIRYVLCSGGKVVRQDGSEVEAGSLLPSAFFTLTPFKKGGFVVGYSLSGGGFGHGVGMSQNGAKNMALAGKNMEEILTFFYKGCQLGNIYE